MKINSIYKHFSKLLLFLFVFFLLFGIAGTTNLVKAEEIQHIYDEAGLLSTSESEELDTMCATYGEDAGLDIIILTHNDPNAVNAVRYIEDFYDQMVYGDSVLLLVDMYNRDVCLQAYGNAQSYIHSKRGDVIIEEISPFLSDGDYKTAFEIYIERSATYMKDKSDANYDHDYIYDTPSGNSGSNGYNGNSGNNSYNGHNGYNNYNGNNGYSKDNILTNIWFQLIVSLAIGAITVGVMAYNSGGKITTGANTYMNKSHSGLIGRRDDYIRTTVTRVKKPENNNNNNHGGGFNSGGFSGGVSSGGHSHSTSSGKF